MVGGKGKKVDRPLIGSLCKRDTIRCLFGSSSNRHQVIKRRLIKLTLSRTRFGVGSRIV